VCARSACIHQNVIRVCLCMCPLCVCEHVRGGVCVCVCVHMYTCMRVRARDDGDAVISICVCRKQCVGMDVADDFVGRLQKEAFEHKDELLGEVASAAQRLWTSAQSIQCVRMSVCLSICLSVCQHRHMLHHGCWQHAKLLFLFMRTHDYTRN
jgi:hypothetical protein